MIWVQREGCGFCRNAGVSKWSCVKPVTATHTVAGALDALLWYCWTSMDPVDCVMRPKYKISLLVIISQGLCFIPTIAGRVCTSSIIAINRVLLPMKK